MLVEQALRETKIRQLNLTSFVCVQTGTSVEETLQLMQQGRIGCVLVCEGNQLAGIFTERDVLSQVIGMAVDPKSPIDSLMTPAPKTLRPDDLVWEAMRVMNDGGYRHVPLVDEQGRVVGIVSVRDVIDFLAAHFPTEIYNLPPKLHQTFGAPDGA
jgi:CBS domain-containing protein